MGTVLNRKVKRDENKPETTNNLVSNNEIDEEQLSVKEKQMRIFKLNTSILLHERNKYVFLATVSEDALKMKTPLSDMVAYLLIKKLYIMIS